MRGALAGLEPLLADAQPSVARMKRFLAEPTSALSRALMNALESSGIQSERVAWLRSRLSELEKTDFAPAPLIDGNVLAEHGLKPGPLFKRVLDEVYDAQLEGHVRETQGAIELALRIAETR